MMDPKKIDDERIKALAAAICIQAAADYKRSLQGRPGICVGRARGKKQYKVTPAGNIWLLRGKGGWHPASDEHIDPPQEYEAFFRSGWFEMLSGLCNGERIIKHLRRTHRQQIRKGW